MSIGQLVWHCEHGIMKALYLQERLVETGVSMEDQEKTVKGQRERGEIRG